MKHLGDITKIHGASVEPVEVIIGGSPCYQGCPRMGCGDKGTMKVMYVRNNATLEWQTAQGKCEKCGMSFIV